VSKLVDITGRQFDKLLVLRRRGRDYLVQCKCGAQRYVRAYRLKHGVTTGCRSCSHQTHGQSRGSTAYMLLMGAVGRARKLHVPCNLTVHDVHVPTHCPYLGIRLVRGVGRMQANSPSLDRIRPRRGYVRGNVIVCSVKANRCKGNLTLAQFTRMAKALRKLCRNSRMAI
jgi:hypothetical protein